jgi:hypothetical protein
MEAKQNLVTTGETYDREIRIPGGQVALDDYDVLERINPEKLYGEEKLAVELLEAEDVEVDGSSLVDGPHRVYVFRTHNAKVAKQYGFDKDEPTYTGVWCTGYTYALWDDFNAVKTPADLVTILDQITKDIAQAREMLTTSGVEIADITYDRPGVLDFWLTTTNSDIAEKFGWEKDEVQS